MQSEEWTQVTARGKRKKAREPGPLRAKPKNLPSRTVTLAKIQADFNGKMKAWQACECRKMMLFTLDRIQPDGGWDISQAICVGSGSFSRDNLECRRRSAWQFVVFVDLARALQTRTKGRMDVQMFAQEPEFTDIDRSFLSTMKVRVLETAKVTDEWENVTNNTDIATSSTAGLGLAAERLNHCTFLYEPFMEMDAQMARQILEADPVLYVGSSMRGLLANCDEAGGLAKRFDQEHDKYQFPHFEEEPNVLEGLGIYWKPQRDNVD